MSQRSKARHNRIFTWWNQVENKIRRLFIFLLLLLIASQLLLTNTTLRGLLTDVDKLEGKAIEVTQPLMATGTIDIAFEGPNLPASYTIYINGEAQNSPTQSTMSLKVKNNDVIEIGGRRNNLRTKVKVIKASPNIQSPKLNESVTITDNLVVLGRVKLK